MKSINFRSWMMVLLSMMPFLLATSGCGSMHKLKTSDLHQQASKQESNIVSQESSMKSLHAIGSIFQNDSSTYWIQFQSRNPFVFDLDKGIQAENGKLLIGGSRLQTTLGQENTHQLSKSHKDSATSEKLKVTERSLIKELEKERKGINWLWLWLLGGGYLLWTIIRKGHSLFYFSQQRSRFI